MTESIDFNRYMLARAQEVADKSPDPSTKCGFILYAPRGGMEISRGYNSVPDGVELLDRLERRPNKYSWVLHGEARALANAARDGKSTRGAWGYFNWHTDGICPICAGILVQAGVSKIIGNNVEFPGMKKSPNFDLYWIGKQKLIEAEITLVNIDV